MLQYDNKKVDMQALIERIEIIESRISRIENAFQVYLKHEKTSLKNLRIILNSLKIKLKGGN